MALKVCPSCMTAFNKNFNYCKYCVGTPLEDPPPCPKCGHPVFKSYLGCVNCGLDLRGGKKHDEVHAAEGQGGGGESPAGSSQGIDLATGDLTAKAPNGDHPSGG